VDEIIKTQQFWLIVLIQKSTEKLISLRELPEKME